MAIPLGINLCFCVKRWVALQRKLGLEDRPVFREVFYSFERDDASILDAVRRSVDISETRIRMKVA